MISSNFFSVKSFNVVVYLFGLYQFLYHSLCSELTYFFGRCGDLNEPIAVIFSQKMKMCHYFILLDQYDVCFCDSLIKYQSLYIYNHESLYIYGWKTSFVNKYEGIYIVWRCQRLEPTQSSDFIFIVKFSMYFLDHFITTIIDNFVINILIKESK